jgi:type I restriction enzyme M protein
VTSCAGPGCRHILEKPCSGGHSSLSTGRHRRKPWWIEAKTNVLFFTKGKPTTKLWLYDARANVPAITKKSRPLTAAHFTEFEHCYGPDPNGHAQRERADSADGRWRSFSLEEIIERGYKIDSFKWLRDDELDDPDEILDPAELVTAAIAELQSAVMELHEIQKLLDDTEVAA